MIRSLLLIVSLMSGGGALLLLLMEPASEEVVQIGDGVGVTAQDKSQLDPTLSAATAVEKTEVLVLRRSVLKGSVMKSDDFSWIDWPNEYILSDYIVRDIQPDAVFTLRDTIALLDMEPGEPVIAQAFAEPQRSAATIEDALLRSVGSGMRAVPVRVNIDQSVVDMFDADDRVDVIQVFFPSSNTRPVGRVLAENIRLLAIEPLLAAAMTDEGQTITRTVVLELASEKATAVMAAAEIGSLSLLLRSSSEGDGTKKTMSFAEVIEPGHRGVTLPKVTLSSPTLIRPNDYVDILFSPIREDTSDEPGAVLPRVPPSSVIVENSRVLEVATSDQSYEFGGDCCSVGLATEVVVTVELDPEGTEVVTAAINTGQVSISLRSANEQNKVYRVVPLPEDPVEVRVRRAGAF